MPRREQKSRKDGSFGAQNETLLQLELEFEKSRESDCCRSNPDFAQAASEPDHLQAPNEAGFFLALPPAVIMTSELNDNNWLDVSSHRST